MNRLSIRKRIIITFGCIIFITVGLLTFIAWDLQRKQFLSMAETQLQDAAGNIVEKISVMQALLDSRKFDGKLGYYLGNQRSSFLQRGYHLNQYLVENNGESIKSYGELKTMPLKQDEIKTMLQKKQGILHIKRGEIRYTAAYDYSLERQALIALVVAEDDYLQPVYRIRNITVGIGILALLISYLAATLIITGITRPINKMVQGLQSVETGKFDISLPQSGAAPELSVLGAAFNHMVKAIRYFVVKVKDIVVRLTRSSAELAEQAGQINDDSDKIARELKKISEEVNQQMTAVGNARSVSQQLSALVRNVLEGNTASVAVSRDILEYSGQGQAALGQVKDEIQKICEVAINTSSTFEHLNRQFEQIHAVNTSLDDIARQTRLLSLNAGIEAARAGEKGRSFRVVAEEISKLSHMSHEFSDQTAALVNAVIKESNLLKSTLDQMHQVITSSTDSVENAGSVFNAIQEQVVKNNAAIEEVSGTTGNMLTLIREVVQEVDIIFNNSEAIVSSIPEMLQSAYHQTENTTRMLEQSSHLEGLAMELRQVTNSMGSDKS